MDTVYLSADRLIISYVFMLLITVYWLWRRAFHMFAHDLSRNLFLRYIVLITLIGAYAQTRMFTSGFLVFISCGRWAIRVML